MLDVITHRVIDSKLNVTRVIIDSIVTELCTAFNLTCWKPELTTSKHLIDVYYGDRCDNSFRSIDTFH